MEKFRYASGIVGMGLKGADGSSGSTGLSMYFTNLNGLTDQVLLRTRIQNNYILWSTSSPLPNGRTYQQGDLFVDSLGAVYYINLTAAYKFTTTNTNFSMAAYFEDSGIDSDNGLNRYLNTFSDYIIDSVYSTTVGDYTAVPANIYSIQPKNFGKIEYSDVVNNTRNPFTLWIASDTCDNNSIALVRETTGDNTFRLGNLDNAGNARNVNIKFDVDKLMVSKDTGKEFTRTTDDGTVITNHEINANSLMTPVFNYSPASFKYDSTPGDTSIRVYWDKGDFLGTTDVGTLGNIPASLFFFRKQSTYKGLSWNFGDLIGIPDVSLQHIVFHNIDISGYLDIFGLVETNSYGMYIQFHDNGWIRSSITKNIQPGITPLLFLLDPCLGYVTTDYTGAVNLTGSSYETSIGFRISASTNVTSGITISKSGDLADYITLSTTTPSLITGDLIDVSVSSTTSNTTKTGTIVFHSSAPDVSVIVTRFGKPTSVTLDFDSGVDSITDWGNGAFSGTKVYRLTQTGMPTNTYINLDISVGHMMAATVTGGGFTDYNQSIKIYNNAGSLLTGGTFTHTGTLNETNDTSTKFATLSLTNLNSVSFPLRIDLNVENTVDVGGISFVILNVGIGTQVPYPGDIGSNIVATYVSGDYVVFTYVDKFGNVMKSWSS